VAVACFQAEREKERVSLLAAYGARATSARLFDADRPTFDENGLPIWHPHQNHTHGKRVIARVRRTTLRPLKLVTQLNASILYVSHARVYWNKHVGIGIVHGMLRVE
jgi:hypothetical protein